MYHKLIQKIRSATTNELIDYLLLSSLLVGYKAPRDVVTSLLKHDILVRIKKGLYIFGDFYRKNLISSELLSNLIYGPSYVSREYALHFHGLIPESVQEITCVSIKRNKIFDTPLGRFSYEKININAYNIAVQWVATTETQGFFIATPEKALADLIVIKKEKITDTTTFARVLQEDYRIDYTALQSLDLNKLIIINRYYKKPIVNLLLNTISEIQYAG